MLEDEPLILPHPSYVYSVCIHPKKSSLVVTGCYDHIVRIWETKKKVQLRKELAHHNKFVNAICFDIKGEKLYSGDGVGILCVWNTQGNSKEWSLISEIKLKNCVGNIINDIICHSISPRIVITCRNNSIIIMDSREHVCIQQIKDFMNATDFIHSDISPCGNYMISGSENGIIHLWNIYTGEKIHNYQSLPFDGHTVSSVKFHPHDNMFACCAYGENFPVVFFKFDPNEPEIAQKIIMTSQNVLNNSEEGLDSARDLDLNRLPSPKRPSSSILKTSKEGKRVPSSSDSFSSKVTTNLSSEYSNESFSASTDVPKPSTSALDRSESSSSHESVKTILAKKQRSIIFEDEVPVTHNWKNVFDKLDNMIHFSGLKQKNLRSTIQNGESSDFNDLITSSEITDSKKSSSEASSILCSSSENMPFKAVALYSYSARSAKELNLKPGDVIVVIRKLNDFWWEGKTSFGLSGIFPSQYVYVTDDSGTSSTS